ncbi:MAG: trypsin-like peptidase domain-containing protein [Desulfobacca sp.]|uniref:trypsin-like peptidase domain-containing protein n=1 Tax=Desulfobacca sp. TaxID=2067990 RepID=UPI00404A51BA
MQRLRLILLWWLCLGLGLGWPAAWAEENLPAIIKRIAPAVVVVETQRGNKRGLGTGFFINAQGHIVTNYHVIYGAEQATVKTQNGRRYPVKRVVAENKEADLVLISADIPPRQIVPLEISSRLPEVGEKIYAIGHPMGLEQTVSEGIVSAIRKLPKLGDIIQITAPISPGSSGGPVFNGAGQVIGVARATFRTGQNLNFAVPGRKVLEMRGGLGYNFSQFAQEMPGAALDKFQQGRELHAKKDYARAVQAFQEAIKAKPDFAEAYHGVGMSYGAMRKLDLAIDNFRQAVRLKPDNPLFHYHLALAYFASGDKGKALEEYRVLARLDPNLAARLKNMLDKIPTPGQPPPAPDGG